ncbi:MAG: type II secretion system protein GspN [Desulfofustis sp.]|nr:type II secretion system protein GspN [Desulfofustis sp.]
MVRRSLIFLFYCLLILGIVIVFLVLLFPRDKFLGWVSSYIGEKLPSVELSIGDIKYVHPLKIRLYELDLSDAQKRWEIPVDTLLMSIEPSFTVDHVSIIGVVFGGDLSFDLAPVSNNRLELSNLQISEILLAELNMLEQAMGRKVEGILSLEGRATVNYRRLDDVRFTGTVRIEKFLTPLNQPVFEETEVRFDRVNSEVVFSGGVVDITGGKASGPYLHGDFSGQIWGTVPLGRSRVEMRGSLIPTQALIDKHPNLAEPLKAYLNRYMADSIPYRVEGTIAEPLLDFENFN